MSLQLSLWDTITGAFPKFKPTLYKKTTRQKRKPRTSDPELELLWLSLRKNWFPDRSDIDTYTIHWSKRPQKRTLATCNITDRRVLVARELNYPPHKIWLEPLIYHEMCHAILGVIKNGNKHSWHGKEFKALEKKHPMTKPLDDWIKLGGWQTAIRSDRGKRSAQKRKNAK